MAGRRSGSLRRMFASANQSQFVDVPSESRPVAPARATVPALGPIAEALVATTPAPDPEPSVDTGIAWWLAAPEPAPEAPLEMALEPMLALVPETEPTPEPTTSAAPRLVLVEDDDAYGAPAPAPLLLEVEDPQDLAESSAAAGQLVLDPAIRSDERIALLMQHIDQDRSVAGRLFTGVELSGARLRAADLSGAVLQRADLSGADLRGASLVEADLRGADLSSADLRGANLRGAVLDMAQLTGADLRLADLREVSFINAGDMVGADLRGADLSGVDVIEAMRGAHINEQTYFRSNWSSVHLVAAQGCGVQISGLDRLPKGTQHALVEAEDGLLMAFSTPLNFMDEYVLRGVICASLGGDTECALQIRSREHGAEVRITSVRPGALIELAETLQGRAWERVPSGEADRALNRRLFEVFPHARLINRLSALVDRLDRISLSHSSGEKSWRPPVSPCGALQHLLLSLFIPVELRWWLSCIPRGKVLVRELPAQHASAEEVVAAAVQLLERRQMLDAALFATLIEERRRREAEIRAVAQLWGVEWYAFQDQDDA